MSGWGIRGSLLPATLLLVNASGVPAELGPATPDSLALRVPFTPSPVVVDGKRQLVYELQVTNFTGHEVRLVEIEIRGSPGETEVARFEAEALGWRLGHPAGRPVEGDPLSIASGAMAVVYVESEVAGERTVPQALEHRVAFVRANTSEPERVIGGRVRVGDAPPLVLGPPLAGGPWAAVHHPAWSRGHRRVYYVEEGLARLPGRFAVDYFAVDADGRVTAGDGDLVAQWFGYGAEVLAVADAVVAAARDDVAESLRISTHTRLPLADGTGNYVALDLGEDRYAFYEHLQAGSVRVSVGQRVRRGDVIAALGFTGHTSGPHLHFHVADANAPLGAEGLPFVVDRFEALGSFGADLGSLFQGPWTPNDTDVQRVRRAERPAPNAIVRFEGAGWGGHDG